MIKILFVCHGNICRSPMALYYFQDLVRKKGLEDMFFLDSAATSTEEIGNSAHRGTRERAAVRIFYGGREIGIRQFLPVSGARIWRE